MFSCCNVLFSEVSSSLLNLVFAVYFQYCHFIDNCWELMFVWRIRGKINRTVVFSLVYHSYVHCYLCICRQFISVGLGFRFLWDFFALFLHYDQFSFVSFLWVTLFYVFLCILCLLWVWLSVVSTRQSCLKRLLEMA